MCMPIHMPIHMSQYTGALSALKDGNAIKVDGAHKLVLRFEESRVLDICMHLSIHMSVHMSMRVTVRICAHLCKHMSLCMSLHTCLHTSTVP